MDAGITTGDWWIIASTGAGAVVGGFVAVSTYRSLRLDRAMYGQRDSVIIHRAPKSAEPMPKTDMPVPAEWDRSKVRYFCLRPYNSSEMSSDLRMELQGIKIGLKRPNLTIRVSLPSGEDFGLPFIAKLTHDLKPNIWVLLYSPDGWNSQRPIRRLVRFDYSTSFRDRRYRKRAWIKPLP